MNEMYLVALVGNHVFQNFMAIGIMSSFYKLDEIRQSIYAKYGVEFEKLSARFTNIYWKFENITDDRDIALYVENFLYLNNI